MKLMATLISAFCLTCLLGCAAFPIGGAKTGFGHSSESEFYLFHRAEDNDNKAEYRIEVDPTVLERLLDSLLPSDEDPDDTEPPSTE
jgi:hypothetical protein